MLAGHLIAKCITLYGEVVQFRNGRQSLSPLVLKS
jgi:hypothetical protein